MQTQTASQFSLLDLQAVRDFLANDSAELVLPTPRTSRESRFGHRTPVTVHQGINRDRIKSVASTRMHP